MMNCLRLPIVYYSPYFPNYPILPNEIFPELIMYIKHTCKNGNKTNRKKMLQHCDVVLVIQETVRYFKVIIQGTMRAVVSTAASHTRKTGR